MQIAEKLVHEGLNLPNTKVVRAKRMPFNTRTRKPGIFKIELESLDHKKEALGQSYRLLHYKALGHRVVIRSSQTHEHRLMINNWRTFLNEEGLDDRYRVNRDGSLRPGDYSQRRGGQQQQQYQQQQYQQQQYQPQQYQPQQQSAPQQQQQFQPQQNVPQPQQQQVPTAQFHGQQNFNVQQHTFPQTQPHAQGAQGGQYATAQNVMHGNTAPTYASVTQSQMQPRPPVSLGFPSTTTTRPQTTNTQGNNQGVLTNQFRFDFGSSNNPIRSSAPGY